MGFSFAEQTILGTKRPRLFSTGSIKNSLSFSEMLHFRRTAEFGGITVRFEIVTREITEVLLLELVSSGMLSPFTTKQSEWRSRSALQWRKRLWPSNISSPMGATYNRSWNTCWPNLILTGLVTNPFSVDLSAKNMLTPRTFAGLQTNFSKMVEDKIDTSAPEPIRAFTGKSHTKMLTSEDPGVTTWTVTVSSFSTEPGTVTVVSVPASESWLSGCSVSLACDTTGPLTSSGSGWWPSPRAPSRLKERM